MGQLRQILDFKICHFSKNTIFSDFFRRKIVFPGVETSINQIRTCQAKLYDHLTRSDGGKYAVF